MRNPIAMQAMKTPMLFLALLAGPLGADSRISAPDSVWSELGQWYATLYISWTPVEGADAYQIYRKRHPSTQDPAWHLVQEQRTYSSAEFWGPVRSSEWSVAIGVRARQDSLVSGLKTAHLSTQFMPVDDHLPAPAVRVEEDPALGHYVLVWPAIEGAKEYGIMERRITKYGHWVDVQKGTVKAGLDQPVVRWKTPYPIRYWIDRPDWWVPAVFKVYAVWTEEEWTSVRTRIEVPSSPTGARRSTWGQAKTSNWGKSHREDRK